MCVYQRVPWLAGVSEEVRLAEEEVVDHSSVKVAAQMGRAVVLLLDQLVNWAIETNIIHLQLWLCCYTVLFAWSSIAEAVLVKVK